MYKEDAYTLPLLTTVETTLNAIGLSGMWLNQFDLHFPHRGFQSKINQSLIDSDVQNWLSDIDSRDIYYNYRLFKSVFAFDNSLNVMPKRIACTLIHFKTLIHKLPIQRGSFTNALRAERLYKKWNSDDIGDELHYVLKCAFFLEIKNKANSTILLD